jgi:hypothetical protein
MRIVTKGLFWAVGSLLLVSTLQAQISVTADDLLALKGQTHTSKSDTSDTGITATVLGSGANVTADYSALAFDGEEFTGSFLEPSATQYGQLFPGANMAVGSSGMMDSSSFAAFSFLKIEQSQMVFLGNVVAIDTFLFVDSTSVDTVALPLAFGDTWNETEVERMDFGGFFSEDSSVTSYQIDGWGMLKLPAGDFEALRMRSLTTEYSVTSSGGFSQRDTSYYVGYQWMSKNAFIALTIDAEYNDGSGNTADSQTLVGASIEMLLSGFNPVSVNEHQNTAIPSTIELSQNFPNPFNPSTSISYSVGEPGAVELAVFDINGRLVRTLIREHMQVGAYTEKWDGRDDNGVQVASGNYIYRLKLNDEVRSKMMIFMK